ncbi:Unannotated [Lentimonas sp. CC4]|nr:Unannotated [Lentimonas sp. CC4]
MRRLHSAKWICIAGACLLLVELIHVDFFANKPLSALWNEPGNSSFCMSTSDHTCADSRDLFITYKAYPTPGILSALDGSFQSETRCIRSVNGVIDSVNSTESRNVTQSIVRSDTGHICALMKTRWQSPFRM